MKPPTLEQLIATAEREGRSTLNISVERLKVLVETEKVIAQLAQQTGITEHDPRLDAWS